MTVPVPTASDEDLGRACVVCLLPCKMSRTIVDWPVGGLTTPRREAILDKDAWFGTKK
jgi:hypothetical protein